MGGNLAPISGYHSQKLRGFRFFLFSGTLGPMSSPKYFAPLGALVTFTHLSFSFFEMGDGCKIEMLIKYIEITLIVNNL